MDVMDARAFPSREAELDAFKSRIDLRAYAQGQGYVQDRKESSQSSAVMRHPGGDKVIVARGHDGHWMYFSVRDERDNGSIIDFFQKRKGGSLGEARKELRPWLEHDGAGQGSAPEVPLLPVTRQAAVVQARLAAMTKVQGHPYLEEVRRIPRAVLAHSRFAGRIYMDERRNAVFLHWNRDGVCGYEIKNQGFTGFAPGGEKGLWVSNSNAEDTQLVVSETAIDALSHFAIKGQQDARYVSTAGSLSDAQEELIASAIAKLTSGGRFTVAVDNDDGGDKLSERLMRIFKDIGRNDLSCVYERPEPVGADWNDVLRNAA